MAKMNDLVRGRMWSLALVNAGGAVSGGEVSITYPQ
jgi:hypothetical protein